MKVGKRIKNTDMKQNTNMMFCPSESTKKFKSFFSNISEKKIRKLFFSKHSGPRDYIVILDISISEYFLKTVTIKVKYNSDCT